MFIRWWSAAVRGTDGSSAVSPAKLMRRRETWHDRDAVASRKLNLGQSLINSLNRSLIESVRAHTCSKASSVLQVRRVWMVRSAARLADMTSIDMLYKYLLSSLVLHKITFGTFNPKTNSKSHKEISTPRQTYADARWLLTSICDFEFVFELNVLKMILCSTSDLSRYLQG